MPRSYPPQSYPPRSYPPRSYPGSFDYDPDEHRLDFSGVIAGFVIFVLFMAGAVVI